MTGICKRVLPSWLSRRHSWYIRHRTAEV